MFSQLVWRGVSTVSPTLFLSRCFWILWWDHCPLGTGVPLGSHVMVLLEQERIETLKYVYFGLRFSVAPQGHLEQTHGEVLEFSLLDCTSGLLEAR